MLQTHLLSKNTKILLPVMLADTHKRGGYRGRTGIVYFNSIQKTGNVC